MKQLSFKAFHQLDTTVIVRQLGNDQMQDHVHAIGYQYHPHDIQHAVLRGKIRNGDDAGTDAVADDHADSFKGREMGFRLDGLGHRGTSFVKNTTLLCNIILSIFICVYPDRYKKICC